MNSEFEEAEEVGKLMTQEEKQRQFNEVFPDRIKKYGFDLEEGKKLLLEFFNAIMTSKNVSGDRLQATICAQQVDGMSNVLK